MSSASESKTRTVLMTYFPMFIATLSLLTSIFNGYLNTKFLDFIQRNTGRTEYMRTCKEIIDAYFQIKIRAGVISANATRGGNEMSREEIDGVAAVNRFAALGTYLANLRDDAVRNQYSALSAELTKVMANAKRTSSTELPTAFANADQMFAGLNDDCVKSARDAM
jgi:hypothetical protein